MLPDLAQIVRDTGEFFTSYKPIALATMIAVPAAIGYGIARLYETKTASKCFDYAARGLLKITGVERSIRRRYNSTQSQGPEQMNLF